MDLPEDLARPLPPAEVGTIRHEMTTTAFSLDGYRTVKTLGVVLGITVRSRSLLGTFGAALQSLRGGNIGLFTELCEKTRAEAFELMLRHAEQHGANAVVGIRYDATELMQGVTEVLCYGTAVIVEPI
ncbi:MAG: YbjQ family protein [Gemmatimonadota bacterium]